MVILRRGLGEGRTNKLATADWAPPEAVHEEVRDGQLKYSRGKFFLGATPDDDELPVGYDDDRHIVTVAGSRAGKGRSAIIPNLKMYPGSVVCIDPKGENAENTAEDRARPVSEGGLGQQVYILDPFGVTLDKDVDPDFLASFNPLWPIDMSAVDALEQVGAVAECLVVTKDPKDAHWDDSARALLRALILHVLTDLRHAHERTLKTVRRLLTSGDESAAQEASQAYGYEVDEQDALLWRMEQNDAFEGVVRAQALTLKAMGAEERGSVRSFATRNTAFLEGEPMRTVMEKGRHNLRIEGLKKSPNGITIYLCLPAWALATHSRWLRLMVDAVCDAVERNPEPPACGHRVLAILDEFPILGNLKRLEAAAGYMAGFHLKLWAILQDLNQIKRDYPDSWETFLGNAGIWQFFGNTDYTTLEFISMNLGETEVVQIVETITDTDLSDAQINAEIKKMSAGARVLAERSHFASRAKTIQTQTAKGPLMTPDEIRRTFRRESRLQLIVSASTRPLYLKRINHDDPDWKDRWANLGR